MSPEKNKKSCFSDCLNCPLYNQSMVIGETNCEDDLSKVRVLILAEAPASEEIKQGKPLVGPAGKVFRQAFEESGLNDMPYYIGNIVSCANIQDGKTVNPPREAVEKCQPNWHKLIEITNPDVILVMGAMAMSIFGIAKTGITKLRGRFYKYGDKDVFLTIHPSYILRQGGMNAASGGLTPKGKLFMEDFKTLVNHLKENEYEKEEKGGTGPSLSKTYTHKIPSKYYTEDYILMDVQYFKTTNQVLYIFRDKDGNRIFHKETDNKPYYYYRHEDHSNSPMLIDVDKVSLGFGKARNKQGMTIYEGDVRTENKHAVDYRINRGDVPEPRIKPRIMYADIEVYARDLPGFPFPEDAKAPINAISFKVGSGKTHVLLNRIKKRCSTDNPKVPEDVVYIEFDSERKLLEAFCEAIKKSDIDIIAGWNFVGFDIPTIFNRMKKLGLNINKLSPINEVRYNPNKYNDFCIYGLHVLDQLELYKELVQNSEESYKLDYISRKTLGESKVAYEGTLDDVYENELEKFIEYSAVDTTLLSELEEKLGHIELKFSMIRICATTWRISETTTGLLDPLVIKYAKERGKVCRNITYNPNKYNKRKDDEDEDKIPGGYVRKPRSGMHAWLIDFDYSSLYPNLIKSFNIGPNTFMATISDYTNIEYDSKAINYVAYDFVYNRQKLKDHIFKVRLDPLVSSGKTVEMNLDQFEKFVGNNILTVAGTLFEAHDKNISFLSEVVTDLLGTRKVFKKKMIQAEGESNENDIILYNCMQMAYKILANALYGVLLNDHFRFFNEDLGRSVTLSGQESIKFAGYHVGNYMENGDKSIITDYHIGYEEKDVPYLCYTDTDSVFIMMGDYLINKGIINEL